MPPAARSGQMLGPAQARRDRGSARAAPGFVWEGTACGARHSRLLPGAVPPASPRSERPPRARAALAGRTLNPAGDAPAPGGRKRSRRRSSPDAGGASGAEAAGRPRREPPPGTLRSPFPRRRGEKPLGVPGPSPAAVGAPRPPPARQAHSPRRRRGGRGSRQASRPRSSSKVTSQERRPSPSEDTSRGRRPPGSRSMAPRARPAAAATAWPGGAGRARQLLTEPPARPGSARRYPGPGRGGSGVSATTAPRGGAAAPGRAGERSAGSLLAPRGDTRAPPPAGKRPQRWHCDGMRLLSWGVLRGDGAPVSVTMDSFPLDSENAMRAYKYLVIQTSPSDFTSLYIKAFWVCLKYRESNSL